MRIVLLVFAIRLAATAAAAEEACLSGASTLPDQRALAALRGGTDAACPCSTFGARRDYQACAHGVLRAALGAGTLRAACKRAAKQIGAGAVCGSDKIACGRFKASAPSPVSCKVRPSSGCTDVWLTLRRWRAYSLRATGVVQEESC